ncbi:MAG: 16S rRNA processing protein RimM [Tenericutes bacterium 4572_104]|nr:MAG: 16S rRNA processing protein RimM [Tenericutes bacterium 4572_104]
MDYIKIGKIVNTRGIKGELKIHSLTDFQNDRYKKGNTIYIYYQNEYIPFKVKSYKKLKNMDYIVLDGFEDINKVEIYKNSDIFVLPEDEVSLSEDEYHISEIIDLKVYQNNEIIGKIKDVLSYPQGDYLKILLNNEKTSLIPFRNEFVIEVNLDKGFIEIIEMEGLL